MALKDAQAATDKVKQLKKQLTKALANKGITIRREIVLTKLTQADLKEKASEHVRKANYYRSKKNIKLLGMDQVRLLVRAEFAIAAHLLIASHRLKTRIRKLEKMRTI